MIILLAKNNNFRRTSPENDFKFYHYSNYMIGNLNEFRNWIKSIDSTIPLFNVKSWNNNKTDSHKLQIISFFHSVITW